MTDFATLIPVSHALWPVTGKKLGCEMAWQPRNPFQNFVVQKKDQALSLASTLTLEQLFGVVSNKCEEVNRVLREQGFPSVQLTDEGTFKRLYMASIFKIVGEFLTRGVTDYNLESIRKPGFRLACEAGIKHFQFGNKKVVVIPTRSDFSLLVTEPTGVTGFNMLNDWEDILHRMRGNKIDGNGVILPMAAIDETTIDVSQLVGLSNPDPDWTITQALMAAKFSLTPLSVKFEAAFSAAARKSFSMGNYPEPGDYVADHPLYFSLVRHGHFMPLAAGVVDAQDLSSIDVD